MLNVLKSVALATVVGFAGHAAAVTNLGLLTTADTKFGNTFYASGTFTDYYTFSIGASSSGAAGGTTDTDWSIFTRDVDVTKITLTGGTLSSAVSDANGDDGFSFTGLGAGTYNLALTLQVGYGFLTAGSYSGTIHAVAATAPAAPVASPAPEAGDFAMALMGLAGVGYMVRRRSAR